MMGRRLARFSCTVAAALPVLALGCADDGVRPRATTSGLSISGRVRIESVLKDEIATDIGVRRVEDATGLKVVLVGPAGFRDSTLTVAGGYAFHNLPPGAYRAATWVVLEAPVETGEITLATRDVVAPDTLALGPSGDLSTYPNPGAPDGIGAEFTAQVAQTYTVEIHSLDGDVVWNFSQAVPAGYYHVHWDGDDESEQQAPAGAYWFIVRVDDQALYGLVFWPGDTNPDDPGHCGHISAAGITLDAGGPPLVTYWQGEQRGDLRLLSGEWSGDIWTRFLDADSTLFAVADTCPDDRLTWSLADTSVATAELVPGRKWTFRLLGRKAGATEMILHAWHLDHVHLSSLPIPVLVEGQVPRTHTLAYDPPVRRR